MIDVAQFGLSERPVGRVERALYFEGALDAYASERRDFPAALPRGLDVIAAAAAANAPAPAAVQGDGSANAAVQRSIAMQVLLAADDPAPSDGRVAGRSPLSSSRVAPVEALPSRVLLRLTATSKVELVELLEDALAAHNGLTVRIRAFTYTPGLDPALDAAWTLVARFHDDEPKADGAPSSLSSTRASDGTAFSSFPAQMTVKLQCHARRVGFSVTCLYRADELRALLASDAGDSAKLMQRRASAFVDTVESLCSALTPLVHHNVRPHHLLFANPPRLEDADRAGEGAIAPRVFAPLRHVGQLDDFAFLICNFMAEHPLSSPPPTSIAVLAASADDATALEQQAVLARRLGGLLPLDDEFLMLTEQSVTATTVQRREAAAAATTAATATVAAAANGGRIARSGGDEVAHMRFSIPRRVMTPHAPADLGFGATAALGGPPPRGESARAGSVLPTVKRDDPPRAPIEMYRDVLIESLTRFPRARAAGAAGSPLRTPLGCPSTATATLARTAVGSLDERNEKKVLVSIVLHSCLADERKRTLGIGQLVAITSNVVQQFRASYASGVPIRFPLSATDKDTLAALTADRVEAELLRGGDAAPGRRASPRAALAASPVFRELDESDPAVELSRFMVRSGAPHFGTPHSPPCNGTSRLQPSSCGPEQPSQRAATRHVVLTSPNWHAASRRLIVVASCSFDIFDGTSPAIADVATRARCPIGDRRSGEAAEAPYEWFLLHGADGNGADVGLDALLALGIAKSTVVSAVPPVTITLEITVGSTAVPAAAARQQRRPAPHALLQEGHAYTIGIAVRRRDEMGGVVRAMRPFVIPAAALAAPSE